MPVGWFLHCPVRLWWLLIRFLSSIINEPQMFVHLSSWLFLCFKSLFVIPQVLFVQYCSGLSFYSYHFFSQNVLSDSFGCSSLTPFTLLFLAFQVVSSRPFAKDGPCGCPLVDTNLSIMMSAWNMKLLYYQFIRLLILCLFLFSLLCLSDFFFLNTLNCKFVVCP